MVTFEDGTLVDRMLRIAHCGNHMLMSQTKLHSYAGGGGQSSKNGTIMAAYRGDSAADDAYRRQEIYHFAIARVKCALFATDISTPSTPRWRIHSLVVSQRFERVARLSRWVGLPV